MPDTWVTYFLSKDIDGDCQRTENLGGRILAAPQPVELGHMALLADAAADAPAPPPTIFLLTDMAKASILDRPLRCGV